MHLYGPEGHIKHYNTVEDIIRDYYKIRLALYSDRKTHQLAIIEHQLKLISYKVKFILMIIDKKLVVNNKKKSELEEELEKLKFPKMGKNIKDTDNSYNYLLSMPIYNLTKEKIDELKNQENDKQIEFDTLDKLQVHDIWLTELEKLEKEYNSWMKHKNEAPKSSKSTKSKKSKTV
jgi:DNA topoisomerase-2